MDDQAVAEDGLVAAGDGQALVDVLVALKIVHPKGIGGKQPVAAHVPVGRVAGVVAVIDDGVPPLRAIGYRPGIIHPSRLLAPSNLFALAVFKDLASGIFNPPRDLGIHGGRHPDRKQPAFFGVAEGHVAVAGAELAALVYDAQRACGADGDGAPLLQQLLAFRPKPIDDSVDLCCAVGCTYDRLAPLQHGSVAGALVPEVVAVDEAVGRVDAAMVVVVLVFALDTFHRIGAGEANAAGRQHGIEVRATHVVAVAVFGKKLAVDGDDGLAVCGN